MSYTSVYKTLNNYNLENNLKYGFKGFMSHKVAMRVVDNMKSGYFGKVELEPVGIEDIMTYGLSGSQAFAFTAVLSSSILRDEYKAGPLDVVKPKFFGTKKAKEIFGLHTSTQASLRAKGMPFHTVPGTTKILYDIDELEKWLTSQPSNSRNIVEE